MKTVAKVNTAAAEFDLNEGVVSVKAAPPKISGVKPPTPAPTRATETPGAQQQQMMSQVSARSQTIVGGDTPSDS